MFPDLTSLATQHPILVSSSALGFVLAARRTIMKCFQVVGELHACACDLYAQCLEKRYRTLMRVRRFRARSKHSDP